MKLNNGYKGLIYKPYCSKALKNENKEFRPPGGWNVGVENQIFLPLVINKGIERARI